MAFKRRNVEIFSLSFLDCICCGFGAVILFYTIISAQSGGERAARTNDLTAEVNRLEEEVLVGTRNLVILRNTLEKTQSETASDAAKARRLVSELESKREQVSTFDKTSVARRERIEKLKADIRSLEEGTRRLEAGSAQKAAPGQDISSFREAGGQRRYITGMRLRGKRILILVDRSASMLHEDLVNVILLRNSSDVAKRRAAKWRRAIDTVSWLVTQLPGGSQFQIYGFNTRAAPVLASSGGKWQSADDPAQRAASLEALGSLVPQEGTSLANAFAATKAMSPLPDQIILITDGLPTQGKTAGLRRYIDANGRSRLFDDAIGELPNGVPVDVVLLPMRGDLPAAHRFWRLAAFTKGTLLMPSKDWP
jgi:anti-sigma28 factor (negative regulator of flagellin synthesis)